MSKPHLSRRQSLLLVGSQLGGQGLLLAATPFLTRHYQAADIGQYQVWLSISLVLTPLANLRHDLLIPGPISNETATKLQKRARLSNAALTLTLILISIPAILFERQALDLLMPAAMTSVTASMLMGNGALLRGHKYTLLSARNLLTGGLAAGLQLAFVYIRADAISLAGALVLGRILAMLLTPDALPWRRGKRPREGTETRLTRSKTGGTRDLPSKRETLASIYSSILGGVTAQLPILTLAAALTASQLGQLAVGMRFSTAPLTILGVGLTQIYSARIGTSLRTNPGGACQVLDSGLRWLATLAVAIAAVIATVGLVAIEPILGDGWETAGKIAAILSISGAAQLATVPFFGAFPMLGEAKRLARLQTVRLLTLGALLTILPVVGLSFLATLSIFSAFSVALYVTAIIDLRKCLIRAGKEDVGDATVDTPECKTAN